MSRASQNSDPTTDELVRVAARENCYDWYLAALLAPRGIRRDLLCLAAYAGEVKRIPVLAREPMMAAIRLQWWRDALVEPEGALTGNPLADRLRACVARHALPTRPLLDLVDAQEADAMPEAGTDDGAWIAHFEKVWGGLISGSARIASGGEDELPQQILQHAATAYGSARLAADCADAAMRQRFMALSRDALEATRRNYRAVPRALRPALLPIALTGLYLRGCQTPSKRPAEFGKALRLLTAWMRGSI